MPIEVIVKNDDNSVTIPEETYDVIVRNDDNSVTVPEEP